MFSPDERDLIVNCGYKIDDYEKTKELADMLAYRIENEPVNAALTVIDAQAEIDALPDGMTGLSEMHEYGYTWEEILPLTKETALELFDRDLPVYQLHKDGSETLIEDKGQITGLRGFHFAGTAELLKRNLLLDNFREIQPENYNIIYAGELSGIQGQSQSETLEAVYEKFNIDHLEDFKGHSLSVSDIVVLHENGRNSAHFVDSYGFTELPDFIRALEGVKEQGTEKTENGLTDEEKQFLETDHAPLIAKNHCTATAWCWSLRYMI